jgi:hypothetical protein
VFCESVKKIGKRSTNNTFAVAIPAHPPQISFLVQWPFPRFHYRGKWNTSISFASKIVYFSQEGVEDVTVEQEQDNGCKFQDVIINLNHLNADDCFISFT